MHKSFKKEPACHLLILLLLSLGTRLGYFFVHIFDSGGLPRAYDTQWYIEHANLLMKSFEIEMNFNGVFYIGYYAPLAFLLFLLKYESLVVLVQMLVNALSVVLVYRIAALLFNNRTAFVAGLIYIATWPLVYWSMFILTDSVFITILLFLAYFLVMYHSSGRRHYMYLFFILSFYTVFYRPNGLLTLAVMSTYILIVTDQKKILSFMKRKKILILIAFASIALLLTSVIRGGVFNDFLTSLSYNLRGLIESHYVTGQIFDRPTPYDYQYSAVLMENYFNSFNISFIFNNWQSILVLFAKKAAFFWAVAFWKLSFGKLYFAAVYLFGIIGIIGVIRKKIFKSSSIIILVILSIQLFCMLFFIDGSFRYRVPALVFLNFYAAFGLTWCIEKFGKIYFHLPKSKIVFKKAKI